MTQNGPVLRCKVCGMRPLRADIHLDLLSPRMRMNQEKLICQVYRSMPRVFGGYSFVDFTVSTFSSWSLLSGAMCRYKLLSAHIGPVEMICLWNSLF